MSKEFSFVKLPEAKVLIESALRKASKEASMKRDPKEREKTKVLAFYKEVSKKLSSAYRSVPKIEELSEFQRELIEILVGTSELKKTLAHIRKSEKIISKLKKEALYKIKNDTEGKERNYSREFLGRAVSVIKKLKKSIDAYNNYVVKLKEIPDVRYDVPTFIIAGFPNVGKTTLLKKLTGSEPKIASYPFTTTKLNIGYMLTKGVEVQVIDTPGLLDRKLSERNKIERKAILALEHLANCIIFVLDPTLTSGYTLEEQRNLLSDIKERFDMPIIVVISKVDIAEKDEIKRALELVKSLGLEHIFNNDKKLNERLLSFWREHSKPFCGI